MDEAVRKKIEPYSASSLERFEVLREFRKTNASTGLHLMPILPFITDGEENFEAMFRVANHCNVHYVLPGLLYLRGVARQHFFYFVEKEFPEVNKQFLELYISGGAPKEYTAKQYSLVNKLRAQYRLSSSYLKPMREKLK